MCRLCRRPVIRPQFDISRCIKRNDYSADSNDGPLSSPAEVRQCVDAQRNAGLSLSLAFCFCPAA
jgi:hypothetical protein